MLRRLTRLFAAPARPSCCATLRFEPLEDRDVPAGVFVAGVGGITQAADPEVSLYATAGPNANQRLGIQLEVFGGTGGDTRIAVGDVNGDGTDDIIAAAGFGGGSEVAIFDGAGALVGTRFQIARFFVYSDSAGVSGNRGFDGGVFVASADLNGDGFDELVTTPGLGGRGHLKVFDFNNGSGAFLSSPALRASAYTFTDYNGEIRVTTLRAGGENLVVTASGSGVSGDVRGYRNTYDLGSVPDRTPVPSSFLAFRVVPFGGFTGGLSVAAGDTDADGDDELFVSKNSGPSTVEVYRFASLGLLNVIPTPLGTFEAFAGFLGEVRLGAADVDGDGRVEVLTTTGFSGDPQGTPVKAFARVGAGGAFFQTRGFFSNPGYQPGAWLAGREFTFATDVLNPLVTDNGVAGALPAVFTDRVGNPDGFVDVQDVALRFPSAGGLPVEARTGAGLAFKSVEVSFSFAHAVPDEVTVTLRYDGPGGSSFLRLFDGANLLRNELFNDLQVTFTDDATANVPAGSAGTPVVGRFRADGGSLANFVRTLPDRTGSFRVIFEDSTPGDDGTVTATVTPRLRLLY